MCGEGLGGIYSEVGQDLSDHPIHAREVRPFDWIAWGLAAPKRPGPFDV